ALGASDQLIGQWIADQLELGPLLPPGETTRALRSLMTRNAAPDAKGAGKQPIPLALAGPKGLPSGAIPECILPSARLALGILSISQRQPEAGVALMQALNETQNNTLRSPWQSPLSFRVDTGASLTPGLSSLTHAADWNLLNALEGFTVDLSAGQL